MTDKNKQGTSSLSDTLASHKLSELSPSQLKQAASELDDEVSEQSRQQLFAKLNKQQVKQANTERLNNNVIKTHFFSTKNFAIAASAVIAITALQFLVINQDNLDNLNSESIASTTHSDNETQQVITSQTQTKSKTDSTSNLLKLLFNNQQLEHQLNKDKLTTNQLDQEYNAILADLNKIKGKIAIL